MIYGINYANDKYRMARHINTQTGYECGIDRMIEYTKEDIDSDFYQKNLSILSVPQGDGYWLWKPYLIYKTLERMDFGDYVIYCDAGAFYVNHVSYLIRNMGCGEDVMLFYRLGQDDFYKECYWSKRDAFILMECDDENIANTPQVMGGFCIFRKSQYSIWFVEQWLRYSQDIRIISDKPNVMGKADYSGFKENRHDQTVLSLLAKKEGIHAFEDPSRIIENRSFPQIFLLHRMGDIETIDELYYRLEIKIRKLLKLRDEKWVLYGAGKNALKIIDLFKNTKYEIAACVISDNQEMTRDDISGIPIFYFTELYEKKEKNEYQMILTIDNEEIRKYLCRRGIPFIDVAPYMSILEDMCTIKAYQREGVWGRCWI